MTLKHTRDTTLAAARPARPTKAARSHERDRWDRSSAAAGPATYFPALDGVRAISVIAVLLYHAGVPWMRGGFLGVSVFFTVSGFVVTRSLLARCGEGGRGFYRSFYAARVRRLLPAASLTLAGVVALSALGRLEVSQRELRWTVLLSNNWYQLLHGDAYAAAIGGTRSPLVHFWSLAIEEQFYLVWPVVLIAVIARRRRPALVATGIWAALTVATIVVGQSGSSSQMYFATWWRLPEILIGCVIALLPADAVRSVVRRRWADLAGVGALALIVAAMVTASDDHGWTMSGGLALFGLVSAVVVGVALGDGFFVRTLALAPLVAIGRVSYGLYLFHWPVFVLFDGLAARFAVTVALTAASWFLVERPLRGLPVRSGRAVGSWLVTWAAVSAALVVAASAAGLATTAELRVRLLAAAEPSTVDTSIDTSIDTLIDTSIDTSIGDTSIDGSSGIGNTPEAGAETGDSAADGAAPTGSSSADNAAVPTRFGIFGDSTAESLAAGIAANLLEDRAASGDIGRDDVSLVSFSEGGCGIVRGGSYFEGTTDAALQIFCPKLLDEQLPAAVTNSSLDVLIVYVSLADTWDRSWDDKQTRLTPDDPEYRQRIVDDYGAFFSSLAAEGASRIVWLRPPVPIEAGTPAASYQPGGAQDLIENTVRELATEYPIEIVDLRSCVEAQPWAESEAVRPDGIHWSIDGARLVARTCLSDLIPN